MRLPNLLPTERQNAYKFHVALTYVRRFFTIKAAAIIILCGFLGAHYIFLNNELGKLHEASAELRQHQEEADPQSLRVQAEGYNSQLRASAAILRTRVELTPTLFELARIIPAGVTLDTVDLSAFPAGIEIRGRAATRNHVVAFQQNIEQSEKLTLSYAPLANLTESTHTPFRFILFFE